MAKLNSQNAEAAGRESGNPPPVARTGRAKFGMIAAGIVLLAGGLFYLYFFNPVTMKAYPTCIFHRVTGLHCPGCGSTRAVHSALHGDFRKALAYNPAIVLLLAAAVGAGLYYGYLYFARRRKALPSLSAKLGKALIVALLVYWLLRNLPFEPFSWLAPHVVSQPPPDIPPEVLP